MKLRPYQNHAVQAVEREWKEHDSTLIVLPTGCGKTVVFCHIAHRRAGRVMILAHREELIRQAAEKVEMITGVPADIEMAEMHAEGSLFGVADTVVSTVQTQTAGGDGLGRMTKFDPMDFSTLIIDEAHHAAAPSYRRVIDYYRQNPDLRVLGVTATPDRADELALGEVFTSVAYAYEIVDAIDDGWLVPISQRLVHVDSLDYSGIRTVAGDLNGGELASILEMEENLHAIASPTIELTGERKTLIFTASVLQAQRLAEIINRHKPTSADWICGKTSKDDRRNILDRYKTGHTQYLVNVGVLTEGFDDPGVEVIVMARPTKSRSLYSQMVGRGTRPLPGIVDQYNTAEERVAAIQASPKPMCEVIDFCGNAGRHKLVHAGDILGGKYSDEVRERATKIMEESGEAMPVRKALEEAELAIKMEEEEKRLAREAAERARITVKASYRTSSVDPFNIFDIEEVAERDMSRPARRLSARQKELIAKHIPDVDVEALEPAQARALMDELGRRWENDLCSYKQAKLLKGKGCPSDITREQASQLIDWIANHGWASPPRTVIDQALGYASPPPPPSRRNTVEEFDDIPF